METSSNPSGPVVLVTGASQGIGAAIAERFSACVAGARLALVASSRERLGAVAEQCRRAGAQRVDTFVADLTDNGQVERMAGEVHEAFGGVDVLINNAGRWRGGAAHEMAVAEFSRVLQENLVSMFAVTRAFLPEMLRRGCGDIFLMSSLAGLTGLANNAAYCAAKHGVAGFSKALRAEVASRGIRVCCVYPGPTESPSWEGTNVDVAKLMSATDIAQVFVDAYRMSRKSMMVDVILRPPVGP